MTYPAIQSPNRVVSIKPQARPLLRLTGPGDGSYYWIHKGKQGSLQTAYQMARLVREDTVRDEGLQRFAAQILINNGLDSHSDKRAVAACLCRYVQRLSYIHDPAGSFDSVSSARQTISKGFGDCDDLAVLLATLLALVGFEPRFVLARYQVKSAGYDHVYVDLALPSGRMPLDPCTRRAPGWESPNSLERLTYPVFAFPVTTLGNAMSFLTTGASIGASFVPIVGPALSMFVGPIASLFSRKQQRAEEASRDEYKDQVLRGMEQIEAAVTSCKITRDQGIALGRELVLEFYKACDQFTKKSVAQSCRNFESQDFPGGPQQGAIKTHAARIAAATCGTAAKAPSGQAGIASTGTPGGIVAAPLGTGASALLPGGSSSALPLLIIGGVVLWIVLQK